MDFNYIKTQDDVQYFLEKTNSLHDGYVIRVQYANDAITNVDENGYFVDPEATKLVLRILVTSICDTVVEIEFEDLLEWQIKYNWRDITDTSIIFDKRDLIVWSDDVYVNMDELKNGSYAVAKSMKWRIVDK